MLPSLKIISANVQRPIANTDGILELAVKRKCQTVCIQERPLIFGKVRRHPGFTTLTLDRNDTRAAIYVDRCLIFDPALSPPTIPFSATLYHRSRLSIYACIPDWIGPFQPGHALETYNAYNALLALAILIHDTQTGTEPYRTPEETCSLPGFRPWLPHPNDEQVLTKNRASG
jgi:hypothetical protein